MDRRIRLASFISRSLCVTLVAFGPTHADKGGIQASYNLPPTGKFETAGLELVDFRYSGLTTRCL